MEAPTSPSPPSATAPVAGQPFAGFQIERLLGAEGAVLTAAARDARSGEAVALRLLDQGRADDRQRAGFNRELDASERLRHPHLPRYRGKGEHQGWRWFARDWVDGPSLASLHRVLPRDTLRPLGELVLVCACVAGALAAAHRQKGADGHPIVHGGLGLDRVRVDPSGSPRLEGFAAGEGSGRAMPVDDDRALAALIATLLTGRAPEGPRPPKPSELVEGFPPRLEELVIRLTDPYAPTLTSAEVAQRLEPMAAAGPLAATFATLAALTEQSFPGWTHEPGEAIATPRPAARSSAISEPPPVDLTWAAPQAARNAASTADRVTPPAPRAAPSGLACRLGSPTPLGMVVLLGVGALFGVVLAKATAAPVRVGLLTDLAVAHAEVLAARGEPERALRVLSEARWAAPAAFTASERAQRLELRLRDPDAAP